VRAIGIFGGPHGCGSVVPTVGVKSQVVGNVHALENGDQVNELRIAVVVSVLEKLPPRTGSPRNE
jgi:hypothetical protein